MLNITGYDNAERVFYYFEEIAKIPHGSGNCAKIADFIEDFAKSHSLECIRGKTDSLIIKKPATKGFEGRAAVALQGHIDMVIAKDPGVEKDMAKEGLDLYIDGDFIKARGTTLGADNGTAVAYMLALLESEDIPHPAIEAIFTTDEETGLFGAKALDAKHIESRLLINLDSDSEGVIVAGCAGGIRVDSILNFKKKKMPHALARLTVSGLIGGHSGMEIDKGRTNAIRALAELLYGLPGLVISDFVGGAATNVIPSSATALIFTSDEEMLIKRIEKALAELMPTEPDVKIEYTRNAAFKEVYGEEDSDSLLSMLLGMKNGVIEMHSEIDGLVETSQNLGVIKVDDEGVALYGSVRSSKEKSKEMICEQTEALVKKHGGVCNFHESYPGWEYRSISPLRDVAVRTYNESYGVVPTIKVIHAGLECGILASKLDGLDAISMGPNVYDIHSTAERLSISSFARVWEHIKKILEEI